MRGSQGLIAAIIIVPAWAFAGGSLSFGPSDFPSAAYNDAVVDGSNYLTLLNHWDILDTPLTPRYYSGFSYDATRRKGVLFGGIKTDGNALGDTWVWDATDGSWTEKSTTTAPSARYGHTLTWMGDKFLLYGGSSSSDTWTYDVAADSWVLVSGSVTPPADLANPAAAFDGDTQQVFLFGGGRGNATWIYHVAGSSWSSLTPSASPSDRTGASMAYDQTSGRLILFGGRDPSGGAILGDTWVFNPGTLVWTQLSPSSPPSVRYEASMVDDPQAKQIVLFGGRTGAANTAKSDIHYFDFGKNRWFEALATSVNSPPPRFGHGTVYDAFNRKLLIFGGNVGGSLVSALWTNTMRSTGTALSNAKNVAGTTPIAWNNLSVSFAESAPGTDILLQVASSSDGVSYGAFQGPDGSTSTFYSSTGTPSALSGSLADRRYLKWSALFRSENPPAKPRLVSMSASYNQAPTTPALNAPANGARINDASPSFRWQAAADPDGSADGPLLYHVQISTDETFAYVAIAQENIAVGASDVSFEASTPLANGVWYWRARAKDNAGLYGNWANRFSVIVDTSTPPSPVTQMSAAMGAGNNEIAVTWVFPGDDKGAINGGLYRIRFGAAPIADEAAWASAQERSGLLTAASGQTLITVIDALATAATYYFAIKTEDELGNLSALSAVSPFAMTNASPTVSLSAPAGGEIFTGSTTVRWTAGDPNSGDDSALSLWLSSSSGVSYDTLITSALAAGATFYVWDTRAVGNGATYRLKIRAVDERGLSAESAMASDFRTDNANEPPVIVLTSAPAAGQKIEGPFLVSWSITDPNLYQTHVADVFLSPDSGASFIAVVYDLKTTSITLDTFAFGTLWNLGNLATYRIKVVVRDSGNPILSAEAVSPVFEARTTSVNSLNLLRPLDGDFPSVFDLAFAWQAPAGFGGGLNYTLRYSTEPLFLTGVAVSSIATTSHAPAVGALVWDTTYYWQVIARDNQGRETRSVLEKFSVSRTTAKSSDRRLAVDILSGLPPGAYISMGLPGPVHALKIVQANQDAAADRLTQAFSTETWHIELKDLSGQPVQAGALSARLSLVYSDVDADGREDATLVSVDRIKIARLNEANNRWEMAAADHRVDGSSKTVSAEVPGFSVFTLVAAAASSGRLFSITSFPNPFAAGHEVARIRYALTENADVTVRVYTLLGDLVRVFHFSAGENGGRGAVNGLTNEITWDGRNGEGLTAANGMYVAVVEAVFPNGRERVIRKIGVLK
ncbi:MAG: hypothetical protein HYT79_12410 [Elusimicrobia bacterium]|nr:hypothetical protein [Elusimicrobiota bacterium]